MMDKGLMTEQNQNGADQPGTPQATPDAGPMGDLQRLQEEVASLKDRYLRSVADMDNTRRRAERDRQEIAKYANERVLSDLLPVLDTFEKALALPVDAASQALKTGVDMVHKQLMDALGKHGLEVVPAKGAKFDPNLHQAIQRLESKDVKEETVDVEYAKGYTLNGRLVRAAMVSVLIPQSDSGPGT